MDHISRKVCAQYCTSPLSKLCMKASLIILLMRLLVSTDTIIEPETNWSWMVSGKQQTSRYKQQQVSVKSKYLGHALSHADAVSQVSANDLSKYRNAMRDTNASYAVLVDGSRAQIMFEQNVRQQNVLLVIINLTQVPSRVDKCACTSEFCSVKNDVA